MESIKVEEKNPQEIIIGDPSKTLNSCWKYVELKPIIAFPLAFGGVRGGVMRESYSGTPQKRGEFVELNSPQIIRSDDVINSRKQTRSSKLSWNKTGFAQIPRKTDFLCRIGSPGEKEHFFFFFGGSERG